MIFRVVCADVQQVALFDKSQYALQAKDEFLKKDTKVRYWVKFARFDLFLIVHFSLGVVWIYILLL